jgi:metal-responsive CopG/Arc/MetJ family transcriptional regulator
MHDDLLSRIDTLARERGERASRADIVRFILKDWLIGHGLMEPEPDDSPEE